MLVQTLHRHARLAGKPRAFYQALAVEHEIIAATDQLLLQRVHLLPRIRCKQPLAPLPPAHRNHLDHKRMQARNIGKPGFGQPMQLHLRAMQGQILHCRQGVDKIAHAGEAHQ